MSAVQPIHKKILAALSARQPKKSPSGQMLLAESEGRLLGGLNLCLEEEHPDLLGRVCVLSVHGALPESLYRRLLSQAKSLGVQQGAQWLLLECEAERVALCHELGFRVLQNSSLKSTMVFYLNGASAR